MLGEKLKELREAKGLVQRQVAAELEVDTAYISKMENSEKPVSRLNLKKMAKIYGVTEKELLPLWLADKIILTIEGNIHGKEALQLVLNKLDDDKSK